MFRYLYEWTQNLAFYMVLITVVLHVIPDSGYKKYIRFFTGMVLILMIVTPVLHLFGMDSQIVNFYKSREYEERLKEIEEAAGYLEDADALGILEEAREHLEEDGVSGKRSTEERESTEEKKGAGRGQAEEGGSTGGQRREKKQEDDSIIVEEIQVD